MRPSDINRQEKVRKERESQLFDAVADDNITKVKSLLAQKVNPDSVVLDNTTPLFIASQENNSAIVKTLLKAKANPDIPIQDGATPLFIAAEENNLNIIRILLDANANANPNLAMNDGKTPLYIASEKNYLDIVKVLLGAKSINPDLQRDDGATSLFIAVERGNLDVVKALLKAKANPNLAMKDGETPLYMASEKGYLDIVIALLGETATNPNLQIDDGATSLFIAVERGNLDVVKALLKAKADPNLAMKDGKTPICQSAGMGNFDIFKALFEAKANPTLVDNDGLDALSYASIGGHLSIVKFLIEYEKENLTEQNFSAALFLASGNGNLEIVKFLLEAGADVNSISNLQDSASPLFVATQNGHLEIVKTLLEAEADVNLSFPTTNMSPVCKVVQNGYTPLDIASINGDLEIVKTLLAKKDQIPISLDTMYRAFLNNNFDILEELYKKIDQQPSDLNLLYFQIYLLNKHSIDDDKINKSLEILFNFLSEDKKIQLLTTQIDGKTILDYAIENNNYSVASLIYNNSIDLIYKDDAEDQKMKSQILIKALKNFNNEIEFFEFIKLVNGNEKLSPEHEIHQLKLEQSPEDLIKINNALVEIKKVEKKHLSDVWELYKAGNLEGFVSLINEDPTKILSFKYIEDEQGQTHPKKTFLHRLAEDGDEKSNQFLKHAFVIIAGLKRAQKSVPNLDLPCDVQYRDSETKINKGEVRGITPLYLAINEGNLDAVKYLIRYSNLNSPIIKENFKTKTTTVYSLFELALENATLDSLNSKNSFAILEMITAGDKKARFPESPEQREKIASKFEKYKPEIKKFLAERYPAEIKAIKKLAEKYKDTESSSIEESGAGSAIQLRARVGVSSQSGDRFGKLDSSGR